MTSEECLSLLELLAEAYKGPQPGFPPELWIFPNWKLEEQMASLRHQNQDAQPREYLPNPTSFYRKQIQDLSEPELIQDLQ